MQVLWQAAKGGLAPILFRSVAHLTRRSVRMSQVIFSRGLSFASKVAEAVEVFEDGDFYPSAGLSVAAPDCSAFNDLKQLSMAIFSCQLPLTLIRCAAAGVGVKMWRVVPNGK